jgi:hypothetical protein
MDGLIEAILDVSFKEASFKALPKARHEFGEKRDAPFHRVDYYMESDNNVPFSSAVLLYRDMDSTAPKEEEETEVLKTWQEFIEMHYELTKNRFET